MGNLLIEIVGYKDHINYPMRKSWHIYLPNIYNSVLYNEIMGDFNFFSFGFIDSKCLLKQCIII